MKRSIINRVSIFLIVLIIFVIFKYEAKGFQSETCLYMSPLKRDVIKFDRELPVFGIKCRIDQEVTLNK